MGCQSARATGNIGATGRSTYCFADRSDAEFVQMHCGGEFVDPNNLGPWYVVNGGRT
jgi:hypothetical protein